MAIIDKEMFYKYLNNAKNYFEYGSGGSTYQASIRQNIQNIYCVESDLLWIHKLKKQIKNTNVVFIHNEMKTRPNTFGSPGKNSTKEERMGYSNQFRMLDETIRNNIDLISIDGRFRVACCLKCFDAMNDNCFIAFDDFLNRQQYHVVLDYYDIVERTTKNRMVILKKKPDCESVPEELITKYELIAD